MLTITKNYRDFPAGHRQHLHDGHCAYIHGHNYGFDLTFGAVHLDDCGFVVDFGKLAPVKKWLTETFDHTLLVNRADPLKATMMELSQQGLFKPVIVEESSAEGLAVHVFRQVNQIVRETTKDRAYLVSVTVWEDSKNSATYTP